MSLLTNFIFLLTRSSDRQERHIQLWSCSSWNIVWQTSYRQKPANWRTQSCGVGKTLPDQQTQNISCSWSPSRRPVLTASGTKGSQPCTSMSIRRTQIKARHGWSGKRVRTASGVEKYAQTPPKRTPGKRSRSFQGSSNYLSKAFCFPTSYLEESNLVQDFFFFKKKKDFMPEGEEFVTRVIYIYDWAVYSSSLG